MTTSAFAQGFIIGILGLSGFYYLLLFVVSGDLEHPLDQFVIFQPWISLLILGFGIQMGLFWCLRRAQEKMAAGTSAATSGLAMVACCAHHTTDVLPILGLSATAVFLSKYQQELLIFGVIANAAGIVVMLQKLNQVRNKQYGF